MRLKTGFVGGDSLNEIYEEIAPAEVVHIGVQGSGEN